jgi:two-component system sensor histidine kinase KdpD
MLACVRQSRAVSDHLIALGAIAVVTVALRLASPLANATTVALCLLLVVLFVARSLARSAAVSASIASVLAFNFFFLPPIGGLTIADPLNWVALLAFLAVALTVSELSARARRQTAEAQAQSAEARRLYAELQAAFEREAETESARRSERLKSALLDAVTHNLRTPITSIKASTTALLSESPGHMPEEVRRELLTVADEEADRLDLLVEDLIGFARIQAGEIGLNLAWCSLEDVIGSAIARASRMLSRHHVKLSLPPDLPVVRGDARSLEEVFFQLFQNAAKYSPPGSDIIVSAGVVSSEAVEVSVDDEGPGVVPEERPRIFDKFYRATTMQGATSGTGLGLAIVKGILDGHGGDVRVTDRPSGRGARFVVRIPIGDDDEG